jgi:hypothetical protein
MVLENLEIDIGSLSEVFTIQGQGVDAVLALLTSSMIHPNCFIGSVRY